MIENIQEKAVKLAEDMEKEVENFLYFNTDECVYTDEELIELFRYMAQSCRMRG